MATTICIAGVTGWTGSAVARAVLASSEFRLVGALARETAGRDVGSALGQAPAGIRVAGTVEEALEARPDVLVDYTHPDVVMAHAEAAISRGVAAVIGTSGLTAADYARLDELAGDAGVGLIAAGNFSITAALAKHFAGIAARHVPHWEILDYADGGKPDAPSGSARELAEFLGERAGNELELPVEDVRGPREARGASIGGSQVHSVRLPGYVVSFEAVFGLPHERLSIRHDSGSGAEPYVRGTLLAARKAVAIRGLIRGLDTLLFAEGSGP